MKITANNKRGCKPKKLFGVTGKYVKTWALFGNEWIYQGMCNQHIVCDADGKFNYSTIYGIKIKQELI